MNSTLFFPTRIVKGKALVILFLFLLPCISTFAQKTWTTPGSWASGSFTPSGLPSSTDDVIITTTSAAYSITGVAAQCKSLTITTGGATTVTIGAGGSLNVANNLAINTGNTNANYTFAVGANSLTVGGAVSFGTGTGTRALTVSTGSISLSNATGTTWTNGTLTLSGNGSVSVTGTLGLSGGTMLVSGGGTMNFSGLVTHSAGTLSNTTTAGILNFNAGYTNSGGTLTTLSGETLNFGGNFTNSTNTLTLIAGSTAVFTNNATVTPTQTITFGHVTINSGKTVSLSGGNIVVAGNWNNNGGTLSGGSNTVSFTGTGTTIGGSGSTTFPNLTIGASGALTVNVGATITCNNLSISPSNANVAMILAVGAQSLTVNGTVTIGTANTQTISASTGSISFANASGLTWARGVVSLTGNGSVSFTGALGLSGGTMQITGGGTFNFSALVTHSAGTLTNTTTAGIINFNGGYTNTGGTLTTLSGETLNFDGDFTNSTNALTLIAGSTAVFTDNVTITPTQLITFGHLTINSGKTLSLSGNINVAGNWNNNGGTLSGGSNTVRFVGTGTIGGSGSTAFPNLSIGLTTALTVNIGTTTTCANLSLNAGAANAVMTLAVGAQNLTVSGSVTVGAASTQTISVSTGSISFTNASGITWSTGIINLTGNGSVSFTGLVTHSNGVIQNSTAAGTINFNGGYSKSGGSFTTLSGETINFGGSLTVTNTALTFITGSTVKFTANATITPTVLITFDNIEITAGNTIIGGNITVNGNWTNSGGTTSYSSAASVVTFDGTTQAIGGTNPTTFPVITVNILSDVTMNNDNSCTGLNIGAASNSLASFAHAPGKTLTVNGDVRVFQPTGTNVYHWNIGSGSGIVSGDLTMGGTSNNVARVSKVTVSGSGVLTVAGDLLMTAPALASAACATIDMTSGSPTLNLGGSFNITNGATISTAGGTSTMNFNGSLAGQNIVFPTTGNYVNLKINNTHASGASLSATAITSTNVTGDITVGDENTGSLFNTANLGVTILAGNTITIAAGSAMDAGTTSVTWSASNAGNAITINGTFETANAAGFSGAAGTAVSSTTNPTITIGASSVIEYTGTGQTVTPRTDYANVVFSGGAKTFATGAVTITGNWAVGSAVTLVNAQNYTVTGNITGTSAITSGTTSVINVGGNWTNTGDFVPSTGIVNFNGSSAQSFTPAASETFNTVKLNNAAGVNLGAPITLSNLTIGDVTPNSIFSDGGNQVTSTGTLDLISGTFKLGLASATTFPGFNTRNISAGTTIEYAANVTQAVPVSFSYQHLSFSGSGTKNLASGTLTVAGNWSVGSAATLVNAQSYNITGNISGSGAITSGTTSTINVGGNWTNNGDFVPSTGTVNFNGASAQSFTPAAAETFNIVKSNNTSGVNLGAAISLSTLTIGDVTGSSIFNDNGSQVTSSGTLNLTSGTFKLGSSGAATTFPAFGTNNISSGTTVEYASGQSQTVSTSPSYRDLTFSGAGTKTVSSGTLSVIGNWAVGSTTALNTNNPTVSITGNITGSGNITSTSGTLSITGNWTNSGTFTHNSGTVNYNNGSGGQTVAALLYRNLTLSNTTGTNTAGGNITVGLNFAMANSGATLDMGANDLSISGGISMSGTIKTQSVSSTASNSSTPLPTGLSWGGTIEYNNATGSQTVVSGTYTNLKLSNTSGIDSAGGAITVNGLLTVTSGGTLNMLTSALTGSLTTAGTGLIKTQNSTATPLPAGITWAPAIEYSRSGTQTVVAGTYSSLTTSGSSTKTMSGSVTVTGSLALTAGTLAVSSQVLTIQTNSLSRTSGSLSVAGTIVFDYNGTITIPSSFITGVNNMTLSSGALVNLPATTVTIAGALNMTSGKLVMASGATLVLGGTVSNMSASNCIVGNTGTNTILEIGGGSGTANMGTIYMDQSIPGTSNTVPTLSFTRSALTDTVGFGNTFRVKGVLTPTRGTVISNGNVVIGSDINGTGKIYPDINPANFLFVGDVKVERYSKSKVARRYIMISSPVDAISVRNAWQDDIFITGVGTGGTPCGAGTGNGGVTDKYNSNGFDATFNNLVSVYRYSESGGGWLALPNTSYQLEKGKGYRVLYRGERGTSDANCSTYLTTQTPPAPSAATLNVSGTLITGSFNVPVDGPTGANTFGYTLLGNPYACELDFTKFVATNPTSISPKYWIYDPNGTNTTTSSTTYLTYTTSGGGEVAGYYHSDPLGNPANYPSPGLIASGQAFFVEAGTPGTVTFQESDKAGQNQAGLFKTTDNVINSKIRIHFRQGDNSPIDNIVVRFSPDPSVTTAHSTYWDVTSFNSGTYLSSAKGTRTFAIQTRPLNFMYDTVQLRIASSATGNFKLAFTDYADFVEAAQIILIDQFTGTQTDVKANPVYSFTITSSSASVGSRFKLVFRSMTSVMPLSYLNISATKKTQGVDVTWKVAYEQGVLKYQVERSGNGIDFLVIGTVESKGNSNTPVEYGFTDTKPLGGVAYYRVKSIENSEGRYSPIVKVNTTNEQGALSIYPNPVKDKLRISLPDNPSFEKGTITIRNSQGQAIMQVVNATLNGYVVNADRLAPGMYILVLTNNNGETLIEKFVKY